MHRAFLAAAVFALACLLPRAARVGLAGDYLDPVGGVRAQDEAVYASSAIHMAVEGGWLTPMFMGRMALYKPPLLVWISGLAVRLAGVSRLALRFPIALLCALAAGLVFWWAAEVRSWQAGAAAVLLLASNHLWHVLGVSPVGELLVPKVDERGAILKHDEAHASAEDIGRRLGHPRGRGDM